jgi:hypothetical protein
MSAKSSENLAPLRRDRVLNSVGRKVIATFDTEEEAFNFILQQPGPSWRFMFSDRDRDVTLPDIADY